MKQLYYHQSSIDYDGTPDYREASDQMIIDVAAEILKRETGNDLFQIELGKNK